MPCHAMQCHAMPCHAMPCHAMPCHAMPCHAMPCHAMPCHAMPRRPHGLVFNKNKSGLRVVEPSQGNFHPARHQMKSTQTGVAIDFGLLIESQLRICAVVFSTIFPEYPYTPCVNNSQAKHALVTSRLGYGNAMLFGILDRLMHSLETSQRLV